MPRLKRKLCLRLFERTSSCFERSRGCAELPFNCFSGSRLKYGVPGVRNRQRRGLQTPVEAESRIATEMAMKNKTLEELLEIEGKFQP